jgi:Cupredoxin-like domain
MNFFSTRGVTRYGVISCLTVLFPPFALAQDSTPNSFWDLETKYIFGFTEGSDIGPEGERTAPEEFESRTLRVEKVVAGNSDITIQLRPLVPGRYRFYGDFNQATAQGALIAE